MGLFFPCSQGGGAELSTIGRQFEKDLEFKPVVLTSLFTLQQLELALADKHELQKKLKAAQEGSVSASYKVRGCETRCAQLSSCLSSRVVRSLVCDSSAEAIFDDLPTILISPYPSMYSISCTPPCLL